MSERFSDKVEVVDQHSTVTILLDGQKGDIQLGNMGVRKVQGYPDVPYFVPGNVLLKNGKGLVTISLDGASGAIQVGSNGADGSVVVTDKTGKEHVRLEGLSAAVVVGGGGLAGRVLLISGNGDQIIELSAAPPYNINFPQVVEPNVVLGGNGVGCVASIRANNGNETIRLDGEHADLILGGNSQDGVVIVQNSAGKETVRLNGQSGDIILGGIGANGDVIVRDQTGKETVRIDGKAGDIVLQNADCAEDFDASELDGIEAGTVVVLDQEGQLRQSREAYDRRVAGVVSGAGDNKPGIVLDKKPTQTNRLPLALVGKVYCKADALFGPIDVGDLLTTSPRPGHAMKADDPVKAFGAVLGKALRPLKSGQGLIPILVALQ